MKTFKAKLTLLFLILFFTSSSAYSGFIDDLIEAIRLDNDVRATELISGVSSKEELDSIAVSPWTPLALAASRGNLRITELLLEKGASVNELTAGGFSALHAAAEKNHKEVAILLISKGADVNQKTTEYELNPLYLTAMNNSESVAELLLEKGADVNQLTKKGISPLYAAAQTNQKRLTELFIEKGAIVDQETHKYGTTPLGIAAERNSIDSAEILIRKGANVNHAGRAGVTPLLAAAQQGHLEMADLLLKNNANPQTKWKAFGLKFKTPLFQAIINKHDSVEKLLIKSGKISILNELTVALNLSRKDIAEKIMRLLPEFYHLYSAQMSHISQEEWESLTPEQKHLLRMGLDKSELDCPICMDPTGSKSNEIHLTSCGKTWCTPCYEEAYETRHLCPLCNQIHDIQHQINIKIDGAL